MTNHLVVLGFASDLVLLFLHSVSLPRRLIDITIIHNFTHRWRHYANLGLDQSDFRMRPGHNAFCLLGLESACPNSTISTSVTHPRYVYYGKFSDFYLKKHTP